MGHRRIVTGVRDGDKSYVVSDGEPPNSLFPASGLGLGWADVWTVGRPPPGVGDDGDEAAGRMTLEPPAAGITWKITTLPPETSLGGLDQDALVDEMSRIAPRMWATGEHDAQRGNFHRTSTIDLVVILAGEVWLGLDDGEVLLRRGDCAIQRGTWHTWRNRGTEPCVISAVMISTVP